MPRVTWPLAHNHPVVQVHLWEPATGMRGMRTLVADTGAGPSNSPVELFLSQQDCQQFGLLASRSVKLSGAISGQFLTYELWVEIPQLLALRRAAVASIPISQLPAGLDGIASFRFLNGFTYGNFGDANQFGLEMP